MKIIKYGNTFTYFINGLLIDTDMPNTINSFYKELKRNDMKIEDIKYIMSTHYHPDHCGLNSLLNNKYGIKLLVLDKQVPFLNFSDNLFKRSNIEYLPIETKNCLIVNKEESKKILDELGINGEITYTSSHSEDGIALIYSDIAIVGDIEPISYINISANNEALKNDWDKIINKNVKKVYFGHYNNIEINNH